LSKFRGEALTALIAGCGRQWPWPVGFGRGNHRHHGGGNGIARWRSLLLFTHACGCAATLVQPCGLKAWLPVACLPATCRLRRSFSRTHVRTIALVSFV